MTIISDPSITSRQATPPAAFQHQAGPRDQQVIADPASSASTRGGWAIAVTVRTASQMTKVSETTLRDEINKQGIPAYRVGRSIRIKVTDLEAWVESLVRVGSDEDVAS